MNFQKNKANLLISCSDKKGLVFEITRFLLEHGANISNLEQHIEDDMFFMRIEWERKTFDLESESDFRKAFSSLSRNFEMEITLDFCEKPKRIGLFCSREGHCLFDILARVAIGELPLKISYILSNAKEAGDIAEIFNIPFFFVPSGENFEHEEKQLEIIRQNPTDFLGLARYMKVLSPHFIDFVGQKIINVHHSFLPSFVGAKPYQEAHERGVKLIGATAHYVIPKLDCGPIIEQRVQRITHGQDIESLKLLGRESEKEAFAFALRKHAENKLGIYKNRVVVFA